QCLEDFRRLWGKQCSAKNPDARKSDIRQAMPAHLETDRHFRLAQRNDANRRIEIAINDREKCTVAELGKMIEIIRTLIEERRAGVFIEQAVPRRADTTFADRIRCGNDPDRRMSHAWIKHWQRS